MDCDMCHRIIDDPNAMFFHSQGSFCTAECALGFMVYILGFSAEDTGKTFALRFGRPVFPMPVHVFHELGTLAFEAELQALYQRANYTQSVLEDLQRYKQNTIRH